MKKFPIPFILMLWLVLCLAACGGGDEAVEEAAPADPTAGFVTITSDPIGVTIKHPPAWAKEFDETSGDLQLATDPAFFAENRGDDITQGAFLLMTNLPDEIVPLFDTDIDPSDPGAVLQAFFDLITTEGDKTFTERMALQPMQLDGHSAARVLYDVEGSDGKGVALFTAVKNGNLTVLMFGLVDETSEQTLLPVLEAVVNSVQLHKPTGVTTEETSGDVAAVVEAPTAVPTPAPEPTAVPDSSDAAAPALVELRQWATNAFASSQYGDDSWSAMQATGAPDTDGCGDYTTAWASADGQSAHEWLELLYTVPVVPTEINILQTNSGTQIVSVEVLDTSGTYREVYTGQPEVSECPLTLSLSLDEADYQIIGVRMTLDQSQLGLSWNEIDAVELVGLADPLVAEALAGVAADSGSGNDEAVAGTEVMFETPAGFLWRAGGEGKSGAADDQFASLGGMAIGPDYHLYVADNIHGVYVLHEDTGEVIRLISDDNINNAADVKVNFDGKIYVAAWGSNNISVFQPSANGPELVTQFGEAGNGPGQFGLFSPQALAVDGDGNIYVLDDNEDNAGNDFTRIQVFSSAGDYLYEFPIEEDFFSATAMDYGSGAADDSSGYLYITGFVGGYVLKIDPATGAVVARLGEEALSFSGPQGISVDNAGNLYVAVWTPAGVIKLDATGNLVSQFGTEIDLDASHQAWPEGGFIQPIGVAAFADGSRVFANDSNGPLVYISAFEMD